MKPTTYPSRVLDLSAWPVNWPASSKKINIHFNTVDQKYIFTASRAQAEKLIDELKMSLEEAHAKSL